MYPAGTLMLRKQIPLSRNQNACELQKTEHTIHQFFFALWVFQMQSLPTELEEIVEVLLFQPLYFQVYYGSSVALVPLGILADRVET